MNAVQWQDLVMLMLLAPTLSEVLSAVAILGTLEMECNAQVITTCMSYSYRPGYWRQLQWNFCNMDTTGPDKIVLIREVSLFWRLKCTQALYLGRKNVSCLERCP